MNSSANETPLPLSVVIATTQPWSEVRACLDSLHAQAQEIGAEVILADGCGRGLTDDAAAAYPEVRWLKSPGASVFYLRGLAMSEARGAVIAVTEDHCRVARDWCARIVAAHREYSDAAAVGGAVENGATAKLTDWASFFVVNGASLAPLRSGVRPRISGQANVSYKRRALPRDLPPLGRMEWMINQELRRRGETLMADGRIVVQHIQSLGFRGTCRIHFDDARSIAGFRLSHAALPERLLRLLACFIMPPALLVRTVAPVLQQRRLRGRLAASLPMIVLLLFCRATGSFLGFIGGAGKSPLGIR